MSSIIADFYEELVAAKRITVSFPSQSHFDSFYAQLRTIKSRYDKKYDMAFGESLSEGKVIRYETTCACDGYSDNSSNIQAIFFLGERKPTIKTQFTILHKTMIEPDATSK